MEHLVKKDNWVYGKCLIATTIFEFANIGFEKGQLKRLLSFTLTLSTNTPI